MSLLSQNAKKVQAALLVHGLNLEVVELSDSTRTAVEAAQVIGCQVAQIVKTLVFRGLQSGNGLLILASGVNRVNEKIIAHHFGEPVIKADADFVRETTGFPIGGVAPLGHPQPIPTYIDMDLFEFEEIWAAAGTPHAVLRLTPANLVKISAGQIIKIV